MEQNNIDDDFKKQLKERKIQPSEKSWSQLELLLEESEKATFKKKRSSWLYVAASIVGLIFVGTIYFTPDRANLNVPKDKIVIDDKDFLESVESKSSETTITVRKEIVKNIGIKTVASLDESKEKGINQTEEVSIVNQQSIINHNQIVVSEQSSESIDSLLKRAGMAAKKNAIEQKQVTVNASSLLSQVDNELEPSFREKVIDKVSKNFQAVKVAISNRNVKE